MITMFVYLYNICIYICTYGSVHVVNLVKKKYIQYTDHEYTIAIYSGACV